MARKTYFTKNLLRYLQPGGNVDYSYREKVMPNPDLIGGYPFTATAAPYPGGGLHPIMRDYSAEDLRSAALNYMNDPYKNDLFRRYYSMLDLKDEDINWLNEKDLLAGANSLWGLTEQQKEWLDWIMNNRDRQHEPMGEYVRRFLRNYNSEDAQHWIYDVLDRASSTKYNPNNTSKRFK